MSKWKMVIATVAVLAVVPLVGRAWDAQSGENLHWDKQTRLGGNLLAAGSFITVDADVPGDVICAGQQVSINGKVGGDVICAAQTITINGEVAGSVRLVAGNLNLNGQIGHNVTAAGGTVVVGQSSIVGWDAFVAASALQIKGKIAGSLLAQSAVTVLDGEIDRNVDLYIKDNQASRLQPLTLTDKTRVGGNLTYHGDHDLTLSNRAGVSGQLLRQALPRTAQSNGWDRNWWWVKITVLLSSLVLGSLILSLYQKKMPQWLPELDDQPWKIFGWGLMLLIAVPLGSLALAVTIIGLKAAAVLMLNWLAMILVAQSMAALAVGRFVLTKWRRHSLPHEFVWWWLALLLGLLIFFLLRCLPLVGWFLGGLLPLLWGLGALWLFVKEMGR